MADILSGNNRYYCKTDSESILVMWRTNGRNIALTFRIKGPNRIFDVRTLAYCDAQAFETDIGQYTTFITNGTDWLGPVIIYANENADGDSAGHFTGGNHGYDNSGRIEGNSSTGRSVGLTFTVDGSETSNFSGYCDSIVIRWSDLVQGANTIKEDGSGREILREDHTIEFGKRESGMDVSCTFTALEGMRFERLYGLQLSSNSVFKTVTFVGSNVYGTPTPVQDKLRGDLNTKSLRMSGDMTVEYGVTEGLADGRYINDCRAFTSPTKSYLFMIDPNSENKCLLEKDESVYYKGFYDFT